MINLSSLCVGCNSRKSPINFWIYSSRPWCRRLFLAYTALRMFCSTSAVASYSHSIGLWIMRQCSYRGHELYARQFWWPYNPQIRHNPHAAKNVFRVATSKVKNRSHFIIECGNNCLNNKQHRQYGGRSPWFMGMEAGGLVYAKRGVSAPAIPAFGHNKSWWRSGHKAELHS